MKFSISITSFVVLAAWAPASSADSPTLTWNRVALEAIERAKPSQHQAGRLLAYVSLAQYAAATEAGSGNAAGDAVAAASMRVIASLVPSQAAFVEERYRQIQPQSGERGRLVADRVLAEANDDGFTQKWSGEQPQAVYAWRSLVNPPAPPAHPAIGSMRTFFVQSGSAFRPAPPPALGSQRFVEDLAEVRRYTESPTQETTRIAKFYDMTTGTMAAGFWNEQAAELIRKGGIGERQAAGILVTLNGAIVDALAACHDAKYVYWVPRPSQADPAIKPLINVPNHPSYPSNHACLSTAASLVLTHFFPQDGERFKGMGQEAGMSRIYAGIHYRFDVDEGEAIGRKVAAAAVARHGEMLSRWTALRVGAN